MSESVGESSAREVVLLSSDSESESMGESECRRLSDEVRSLMAELSMMPRGVTTGVRSSEGIEGYLERPEDRERARLQERVSSGSGASSASRPSSVVPPPGELVGQELIKWHLGDGIPVQEPKRSMTAKEIEMLRVNYRIPVDVTLRPLKAGELATNPPDGWVAVHEQQFKCGLTLPLHPWVQQMLSALGLAVAQVSPNMWRQLLGMFVVWEMAGNGWPTVDEVLSFYKLTYSSKRYCSGTVSLSGRGRSVVAKLPTSTVDWRTTVCLAGGNWECGERAELRKFVPRAFKPIGCNVCVRSSFNFLFLRWVSNCIVNFV